MVSALPYAGWALLGALALIWLGQKLLGKWIESAASAFQEWLIGRFAAKRRFRRAALRRYVAAILEDYDKVPVAFIEREEQRPSMRKIYVPLQTLDEDDRRLEADAYDSVRRSRRTVVIGPPGSGKSMLLKNSILIWAEDADRLTKQRHFWQHKRTSHHIGNVPVLVELRRCAPADGIPGIATLIADQFIDHGFAKPSRFVDRALQDGDLTILFDGLDEVATAHRKQVCNLLGDIATRYSKCQMIVTCRTAIYQGQLAEKFADVVRVADFDDAQIRRFMHNWQRRPGDPVADQLLEVLREVPRLMQLARNPLLLTLIAYLYAYRGKESKLPRSRAQFYKEATDLLLRNKPELDYAQATKMAVLQRLALAAQDTPATDIDRQVLPYAKVISTIKDILPATVLKEDDIQPLLDEIVARSGIIKQIKGEQSYHFAHLTLQEFLAAAELADRPDDLMQRYHGDPAIWRETIKLWCGYVSRDSKPVIGAVFETDPVLAFECLADAVQVDEALTRKITEFHEARLGMPGADDEAVTQAFGAVASDQGERGQAVLSFLTNLARATDDPRQGAALRALAASKLPQAAKTLAELYPGSQPACDALRTMGDLAVPAYASHASRGELAAVDDLAAIATPAAARELVRLLDSETHIATRAAWRIALLIQNPDVEETLRASEDLPVPSGPRLDPVWAPFGQSATAQWPEIMSRVAYLIENSSDGAIPGTGNVDRRIAIPLAVAGINNLLMITADITLPEEFNQVIESASAGNPSSTPLNIISRRLGSGRISLRRWDLGKIIMALPEDAAIAIFKNILEAIDVRKVHQALFSELTPGVQRRIFHSACQLSPRGVSLADWPDSFTPRTEPKTLTSIAETLTGISIGGALILSTYTIVELFKGSWTWGPSWLPWLVMIIPVTIALGVLATLLEESTHDALAEGAFIGVGLGAFTGGGFLLLCSIIGMYEFLGWRIAALITGITVIVLGLLWWIVYIQKRRMANPMRGLLEVDEQDARNRTSIVA
jgi:NACHT domain-containing protein